MPLDGSRHRSPAPTSHAVTARRTADHATWEALEAIVSSLVGQLLAPTGAAYTLAHIRGVPPVVNEDVSTQMLADAAVGEAQQTYRFRLEPFCNKIAIALSSLRIREACSVK